MAFINEKISEEILEQYDIESIIPHYWYRALRHQWTIDKERGIWLYQGTNRVRQNYEDSLQGIPPDNTLDWGFFYDDQLIILTTDSVHTQAEYELARAEGKAIARWELLKMVLPESLHYKKDDILQEIIAAFRVYKGNGINSYNCEYIFSFDVQGEES